MTYMKILLLLMFCTVLPMQAQQMKKLTDLKDFEARLLQEAKNIESIESNFTQIKYLDVLNPEKPDVPLNKNDAFQKVQKRRVQEKR